MCSNYHGSLRLRTAKKPVLLHLRIILYEQDIPKLSPIDDSWHCCHHQLEQKDWQYANLQNIYPLHKDPYHNQKEDLLAHLVPRPATNNEIGRASCRESV